MENDLHFQNLFLAKYSSSDLTNICLVLEFKLAKLDLSLAELSPTFFLCCITLPLLFVLLCTYITGNTSVSLVTRLYGLYWQSFRHIQGWFGLEEIHLYYCSQTSDKITNLHSIELLQLHPPDPTEKVVIQQEINITCLSKNIPC